MPPSIVNENFAILMSHKKPSSDLEGVTVDGDVELLDPSGNRLKKQKDTPAVQGMAIQNPQIPVGIDLGSRRIPPRQLPVVQLDWR